MRRSSLAFSLVLASGLVGCGGKSTKEAPQDAAPPAAAAAETHSDPVEEDVGEPPPPLPEAAADPEAPKDPASYCDQVRALQGTWTLATSVVGARSQAAVGVTDEYALAVTAEDCEAKAVLRHVGENGKALEAKTILQAEGDLAAAEMLGLPVAASGGFAVTGGEGERVFAFVVREDRLFGYWFDAGPRWKATGASGVLTGARDENEPEDVGSIAAQPCPVRCLVGCDTARRKADETFVPADLDACIGTCDKPEASATCGEAPPLRESEILAMHGPVSNLGQACNALLDRAIEETQAHPDELEFGCTATIEFGGKKSPKLGEDALDGSFELARFFETGHEYQGHNTVVRLAYQTAAGWYVSDPVLDSSSGGLVEHNFDRLDLYPRELADAPGKEVVAVLANHVTQPIPEQGTAQLDEFEMTAMCRAAKDGKGAPHCAVLRTRLRHVVQTTEGEAAKPQTDEEQRLDLAFLPGGRVSISAGKGGPARDARVGIWTW